MGLNDLLSKIDKTKLPSEAVAYLDEEILSDVEGLEAIQDDNKAVIALEKILRDKYPDAFIQEKKPEEKKDKMPSKQDLINDVETLKMIVEDLEGQEKEDALAEIESLEFIIEDMPDDDNKMSHGGIVLSEEDLDTWFKKSLTDEERMHITNDSSDEKSLQTWDLMSLQYKQGIFDSFAPVTSGWVLSEGKEHIDLFDYMDSLPAELQEVFQNVDEELSDEEKQELISKVNELGYTFDFDMDGSPMFLRPIQIDLENLKVGDIVQGKTKSTYDSTTDLFQPKKSFVIRTDSKRILSIHDNPYNAIQEAEKLKKQHNDYNGYSVHF